jgi:phosphopantetheine--protein transferase-like protein
MMSEELLRDIVAEVARVERHQISATTSLASILSGSLGRARLDAQIRARLGISNPAIYRVATYGELLDALGWHRSAAVNNTERRDPPVPVFSREDRIRVGVDIENIAALPTVSDYWEDEFYRRMFTSQEIAYALMQTQPRVSLAAIWCAKEALRKVRGLLTQVDWSQIEVVHDPEGEPSLKVDGIPVAGSLSLSHTEEIAIAVLVTDPQATTPPDVAPPAHHVATTSERKYSGIVTVAAWLGLLLAAASIAIQFFRL